MRFLSSARSSTPSTRGWTPRRSAVILDHAESRLILCDPVCLETARAAAEAHGVSWRLFGDEAETGAVDGAVDILADDGVARALDPVAITDEWQPICLNYTSGTTGRPKGVVYHHRGAYLNALGNVLSLGLDARSVYLWTLPMFHCNGWCHTWAVTAAGGLHVCLDRPDPQLIFDALAEQAVTHMACAPVVLYMLLNHPARAGRDASQRVLVATGGSAPTSALIAELDELGFDLIHLYGLTEFFGPATLRGLSEAELALPATAKAVELAKQGTAHVTAGPVHVVDDAGNDVPADGSTLGEIVLAGNTLMAGYYRDPEATEDAFRGGAFHTSDLAVRHPDGNIEIKDRSQGRHHLRRRKHIQSRTRERPPPAPGRPDGGGGRGSRPEMGRGPLRLPRTEGRLFGRCRGDARLLQSSPPRLQGAAPLRRLRTAEDGDRQDPEICAARTGPRARQRKSRRRKRMTGAAEAGRIEVDFNSAALEGYLRQALPDVSGPMTIERISGGQSNPSFFVSFGATRLVLRKQPPGELLPSAHAVDREFRVMGALASTPVPVPEMRLFCDDRTIVGTPFYVMERIAGRVFHDARLEAAPVAERRPMYRSVAASLATLHRVDPDAVGLGDYRQATGLLSPGRSPAGPGNGTCRGCATIPTSTS